MTKINLAEQVGSFAEDKDVAGILRQQTILPALETGEKIQIDFEGISLATQSFIHALIAEALRRHGESALDLIDFMHCNKVVRGIVETVVQYVLETSEK